MRVNITAGRKIMGSVSVPGDKSVSHRAVMLGAISEGKTIVENFLNADDCCATIQCFRDMGVEIQQKDSGVTIFGRGLHGLKPPKKMLYAGNSGTTTRLLAGILSGQRFTSSIEGDAAVNSRPMERIIKPLTLMGAKVTAREGGLCPMHFEPSKLKGIDYTLPVASAQLKSAVLLAGLYAKGQTTIRESRVSRDHTELMLRHFGGEISGEGGVTRLTPTTLYGQRVTVPSDISSAAFFMVAALISKDGSLVVKGVGVNPTRTGVIDVLRDMGGHIEFVNFCSGAEPCADIYVKASKLRGIEIGSEIMPRLIDELPAIAVAAAFAEGRTVISGAEELRVKECDRISALCTELSKAGADITETPDGMIIQGRGALRGGAEFDSYGDHRIAMAMSVAAAFSREGGTINGAQCVSVSFPEFFNALESVLL